MSTDFRFHGILYRAGLIWEQAPGSRAAAPAPDAAARPGLLWLTRAVRLRQARTIVMPGTAVPAASAGTSASGPSSRAAFTAGAGLVGFDRRMTRHPALLSTICRHLGLGPRDSAIVLLGEDERPPLSADPRQTGRTPRGATPDDYHAPDAPNAPDAPAARRHAVLVMADGALIPGGSDMVFVNRAAALSHIDSLTRDRAWPHPVIDARLAGVLANLPGPLAGQPHDFRAMAPAPGDHLGPPPLTVRLALSRALRGLALTGVLAGAGLWLALDWLDPFAVPPPVPVRVAHAPPRHVPPGDFITACDRALAAHPPGLPGWHVARIACYLATPTGPAGPSAITGSAQLMLVWHPAGADAARARRFADAWLAAGFPWSLVLGEDARAAVPLDLHAVPSGPLPALGRWRRQLDSALGGHVRQLTVNLATGRIGFDSPDPPARLAARLGTLVGLEIDTMVKNDTGWHLDGHRPGTGDDTPAVRPAAFPLTEGRSLSAPVIAIDPGTDPGDGGHLSGGAPDRVRPRRQESPS